jgi:hypothetical protein
MKFVIGLISLLFTSNVWASGTFSFEPRFNAVEDKQYFVMGLGVYEKLFTGVAYNSWTGMGDGMSEDMGFNYSEWAVSKHQIDFKLMGLTVSPGIRFLMAPMDDFNSKNFQTEYYGRLSFRVW